MFEKHLSCYFFFSIFDSDNRMRPTPPWSQSQRTAIDVTRNPSSAKDNKVSANIGIASAMEKNLASEDQDNDLSSKIRHVIFCCSFSRVLCLNRALFFSPLTFALMKPRTPGRNISLH